MGGRKGKKKSKSVSKPKKPNSKPSLVYDDDDSSVMPCSLDREENSSRGKLVCYNEPLRKEHDGMGGGHTSSSTPYFTTPLRRIRDAVLEKNGELACICSGFHEEFCEVCIDDASSFTGDERDVETRFEDVRSSSIGAIITKRDLGNKMKVYPAIPCDLQPRSEEVEVEDEGDGVHTTLKCKHKSTSFDFSAALGITPPAVRTSKTLPGQGKERSGNIQAEADNSLVVADLGMEQLNHPDEISNSNLNLKNGPEVNGLPTILADPNTSLPSGLHEPGLQLQAEATKPAGNPMNSVGLGLPKAAQSEGTLQNPNLNKHVFRVPIAVSEKGRAKWEHSIVGHFLGPYSPLHHVKMWAEKMFKCGDTRALDKGFFILTFKNEEDVERVLNGGPYFLGNKLFVTKKWTPGMLLSKGKFATIPLWVKLRGVPIDLWTEEGLIYLATLLGKPIQVDEATLKGSRMKFARVCIEVDATKDIMKKFDVDLGFEEPSEIRVEVPWKPIKCNICEVFGHSSRACYKNPAKPNGPKQIRKSGKAPIPRKGIEVVARKIEPKVRKAESKAIPPQEYPWLTKVKGKYVKVGQSSLARENDQTSSNVCSSKDRVPPDLPA